MSNMTVFVNALRALYVDANIINVACRTQS